MLCPLVLCGLKQRNEKKFSNMDRLIRILTCSSAGIISNMCLIPVNKFIATITNQVFSFHQNTFIPLGRQNIRFNITQAIPQ